MAYKIIAVVNQKGGVGKTTTAVNLAIALALDGKKVLLCDLDPNPCASKYALDVIPSSPTMADLFLNKSLDPKETIKSADFEERIAKNLSVIPARINLMSIAKQLENKVYKESLLARQLNKIEAEYDYIILDLPHVLSTFLPVNALYVADFILIPVRYERDALEALPDLFDAINEIKEGHDYDYKILRTGYDSRNAKVNKLVDEALESFVKEGHVLNTIIRQNQDIENARSEREAIFTYSPRSHGAIDYRNLSQEILNV